MEGFKHYLERSEEQADIQRTLGKLPPAHRDFLRGFTISFQGTNTLNNDGEHVGVIQTHPRPHITLASPWNYGRETTLLHEIGHLIWAHLMTPELREEWSHLVASTPVRKGQRQDDEEMFSMAYAATYAKHPVVTYYKPEWISFIKKLS